MYDKEYFMKKEKIVSVRLPKEIYIEFNNLCESNYRSMSEYIRWLIAQELKKEENEITRRRND